MTDESHAQYDLTFHWQREPESELLERHLLEAVEWVLRDHQVAPGTGISLVITTDEEIRRLNQQFRGVDAATDVLSFPADSSPFPEEEPYLGDLILALPYIQHQAAAERHSVSDEMVLGAIHGTLHLLGYDHDTPERQSAMWSVQAKALGALGVDIVVPLFEFADHEADLGSGTQDESAQ